MPALTSVFSKALANGVSNVSFSMLSADLGRTMYEFSLRIPPYYTLLVRTLSVLEVSLCPSPVPFLRPKCPKPQQTHIKRAPASHPGGRSCSKIVLSYVPARRVKVACHACRRDAPLHPVHLGFTWRHSPDRPGNKCDRDPSESSLHMQGIALSADRNYKVLGSAYPWIARRLLADHSAELQDTLRALLYKGGRFQFGRLESLLRQAVRSPPRASVQSATRPDTVISPGLPPQSARLYHISK